MSPFEGSCSFTLSFEAEGSGSGGFEAEVSVSSGFEVEGSGSGGLGMAEERGIGRPPNNAEVDNWTREDRS